MANATEPAKASLVKQQSDLQLLTARKLRVGRVFHLLHRFIIVLCSLGYIFLCFNASYDAVGLLRGRQNAQTAIEDTTFDRILAVAGEGSIRDSPLVKEVLAGSTAPINGTLYLTDKSSSFSLCENTGESQASIYGDSFQRSMYTALTQETSYHITEISPKSIELIAPVVDCTVYDVSDGDATGFYIKAESEQSNINNYVWIRETQGSRAVGRLDWVSIPVLHDSWAWVHGVQFFIGMNILSNLFILSLATYRNLRPGKWWIGDAFMAISSTELLAAAAVLFSWFMNEFWCLHEFCFVVANVVSGYHSKIMYESHTRVDMLTIYLGACSLIGRVFHERIDPIVPILTFLIGYEARVDIINLFPAIRDDIIAYSDYAYTKGVSPRVAGQDRISPMSFWTTHAVGKRNYAFVMKCLLPIYIMLVFIVAYIVVRKVYRHFSPEKVHVQRDTSGTATSENERSYIAQKRVLTLFEIATGAELENRFGVVSDYETCVFIKGTKYVSPDGMYSNGFVIANKKYLLQTSDYWSIVLMKLLGRRFRNIYVYDVNGRTVQQTARLVYPHTLTVQDLLHINVNVLT